MPRGNQYDYTAGFSDGGLGSSALAGQPSSVTVHFSVDTHDTKNPRLRMHVSNLPAGHTEEALLEKVLESMRSVQCGVVRTLQEGLDLKAKTAIKRVFESQFEASPRVQITRVDEPCTLSPTTQRYNWEKFKKSNPLQCDLTTWTGWPMEA